MGEIASDTSDAEKARKRTLSELDAEYGPDWSQHNAPGSFGCHELLDRANLIGDLVEESLLNHPACIRNPEWFAMAYQAVDLLRELYQRIGQDHPGLSRGPDRENVGFPKGGMELLPPSNMPRSRAIDIS